MSFVYSSNDAARRSQDFKERNNAIVKWLSVICVLLFLLLQGCDVDKSPLSDPADIYDQALAAVREQNYVYAKQLLEQVLPQLHEQAVSVHLDDALFLLSRVEVKLGEFRASLNHLQEASVVSRKEGNTDEEMQLSLFEADLYESLHEDHDAVAHYQSTLLLASAFDHASILIETKLRIASMLLKAGEDETALDEYKSLLDQTQSADDRSRLAEVLQGLGRLYGRQQKYAEALNAFAQAESSVGEVQNPLLASSIESDLGYLHMERGSINEALRAYREAVNILRQSRTGTEYEPTLLFQIAQIYENSGRLAEAKKYYGDALETARKKGDRLTEYYCSIFVVRCNFTLMTPEQRIQNENLLLQSYEQLARKFNEIDHPSGEGYLYNILGSFSEQAADFASAREYYLKAVVADQNTFGEYYDDAIHGPFREALHIRAGHTAWYSDLAALLLKMNQSGDALKILELSKAREYAGTFRSLNITIRHPQLKQQTMAVREELRRSALREMELGARLANRRADLAGTASLRAELEASKKAIQKESYDIAGQYPNYETLVLPKPVEIVQDKKSVPAGTIAVRYFPMNDRLSIFVLTRSELFVRTSPIGRDSLMRLLDEYKSLMQDPAVYSGEGGASSLGPMTRYALLSTQLYDLLFRPIEDLYQRSMIIAPSDGMEDFPFHALERQDAHGVHYLVELTSVDYVPSLSALRYISASAKHLNDVVAFGNPTGKNWSVDYELRDIRSFFKGVKILVGLEASWTNLKSVKADVLQLSTDFGPSGIVDPLGTISLSDGLTVEQSTAVAFEKLSELNAPTVFLLSNRSTQSALSARQAMLLRINGVTDVFLNAWIADRKAAKFFSQYFFTQLANGLAPGDAYRQALLNMIRERDVREVRHQRSWGQFFHYGIG
jgi:tetratricopeptide (TPR) repeat protein